MPSFVGLSPAAAYRLATTLGLHINLLGDTQPTPAAPTPGTPAETPPPSGPVTAQSPESGYRALPGDTVRLTLGH
jgi:hypothetical protein